MKRIIFTVLALMFLATTAHAGIVFIGPVKTPNWVIEAMDAEYFWYTPKYAYAVGVAKNIRNHSLLRTTAEDRARTRLIEGLKLTDAIIRECEIVNVWEDQDSNEFYALARMPIKIVAREK